MLNVESTTLHLRGISSDATIELLGEDNLNGVSVSKVGMRFIPYVCDTGWNTVALPAVCTRKNLTYPLSYSNNAYPEIQNLDNNQWFYAATACRAYDDNGAFNEGCVEISTVPDLLRMTRRDRTNFRFLAPCSWFSSLVATGVIVLSHGLHLSASRKCAQAASTGVLRFFAEIKKNKKT